MKREIKFRAFNKSTKEMKASPDEIQHLGSWFDSHLPGAIADIGNIAIMQYTGLKDRNGKEIYEGDILDGHSDGYGIVVWSDFDGGYGYQFNDEAEVGIWEILKDCLIIGNIYKNPELINQ